MLIIISSIVVYFILTAVCLYLVLGDYRQGPVTPLRFSRLVLGIFIFGWLFTFLYIIMYVIGTFLCGLAWLFDFGIS
jgi:hypothetical protein